MNEDVWAERDTNPDAIEAAMRELLRVRHAANPGLAPARVLNMVVILDREWKGEIANRLERAGRYHGSRTILCAVSERRTTLDAVATVRYEDPGHGTFGVMREQVEIEMGPEHLEAIQTIVDPILVEEMPTVAWAPHGHDDALRALLPLSDVVLVDSDDLRDPAAAFERAELLGRQVYVVDLAWLRTTPWRERLAASFDLPERLAELPRLTRLEIRHQLSSVATGLLLCGWLSSRLGWDPEALADLGRQGLSGTVRRGRGEVDLRLVTTPQQAPGLAGVTIGSERRSLSLQRAAGGLDAREERDDGDVQQWKILGASRGEAGILGEGIRQALLRDPTYLPALDAAKELCEA